MPPFSRGHLFFVGYPRVGAKFRDALSGHVAELHLPLTSDKT
jgi:hypothetical protein